MFSHCCSSNIDVFGSTPDLITGIFIIISSTHTIVLICLILENIFGPSSRNQRRNQRHNRHVTMVVPPPSRSAHLLQDRHHRHGTLPCHVGSHAPRASLTIAAPRRARSFAPTNSITDVARHRAHSRRLPLRPLASTIPPSRRQDPAVPLDRLFGGSCPGPIGFIGLPFPSSKGAFIWRHRKIFLKMFDFRHLLDFR